MLDEMKHEILKKYPQFAAHYEDKPMEKRIQPKTQYQLHWLSNSSQKDLDYTIYSDFVTKVKEGYKSRDGRVYKYGRPV